MRTRTVKSAAIACGISAATITVGIILSNPRPLQRFEAQALIDRELCDGHPCPIAPAAQIKTDPSDEGVAFTTEIVAPRNHVVRSTPYGIPTSAESRYAVIGIASRTTLGFWWKSVVNIGIRPYQFPSSMVLVDNRYDRDRLDWAKRNWDVATKADLFAEISLAQYTSNEDVRNQAQIMIARLISKPENLQARPIASLY